MGLILSIFFFILSNLIRKSNEKILPIAFNVVNFDVNVEFFHYDFVSAYYVFHTKQNKIEYKIQ